MRILSGNAAEAAVKRLAARSTRLESVEPQVQRIVDTVRRGGDRALRRYAERLDGLAREQKLALSSAELKQAWRSTPPRLRDALAQSAKNIRRFCEWQKPVSWTRSRDGISLGQRVIALDSVGCYVPGGRHPLVSTLLMTVIPAQVAGVRSVRVTSPNPSTEV